MPGSGAGLATARPFLSTAPAVSWLPAWHDPGSRPTLEDVQAACGWTRGRLPRPS